MSPKKQKPPTAPGLPRVLPLPADGRCIFHALALGRSSEQENALWASFKRNAPGFPVGSDGFCDKKRYHLELDGALKASQPYLDALKEEGEISEEERIQKGNVHREGALDVIADASDATFYLHTGVLGNVVRKFGSGKLIVHVLHTLNIDGSGKGRSIMISLRGPSWLKFIETHVSWTRRNVVKVRCCLYV